MTGVGNGFAVAWELGNAPHSFPTPGARWTGVGNGFAVPWDLGNVPRSFPTRGAKWAGVRQERGDVLGLVVG